MTYPGLRILRFGFVGLIAGTMLLSLTWMDAEHATAAPLGAACNGKWQVIPSPNVGKGANVLEGVATLTAADAWVVGTRANTSSSTFPLTQHWNGTKWTVVPTPSMVGAGSGLHAVAAFGPKNAWAVGYFLPNTSPSGLILHWDGAHWTVAATPQPQPSTNLFGVGGSGPNDIWAVGSSEDSRTVTVHWNGVTWKVIPSPNVGKVPNALFGVTAISPKDAWAVGRHDALPGHLDDSLLMHWNGTKWSIVPNASDDDTDASTNAVTSFGGKDVWAAGSFVPGTAPLTLAEHWSRTAWSVVSTPAPQPGSLFYGISGAASKDVWAVGGSEGRTLTQHWDGALWKVVHSPNVGTHANVLNAVSAVSGVAFAAGARHNAHDVERTLVERFC